MRDLSLNDHGWALKNRSLVHVGINAGKKCKYDSVQNLMTHYTSKFQVDGGLGSADIGDLVTEGKILKFRLSERLGGP